MTDTSNPSQGHILLCDDSNVERSAVARWLVSAGFDVHEAVDGTTAIAMLRDLHVDLVLLDLNMPKVDGFGVLEYLRQHRRALPVILMSGLPANRIQNGIARLKSHELPPMLLKPVDPDQLLALVDLGLSGELSDLTRET